MHRDLSSLSESPLDLLVVGGGIVGACVAWDAALRGMRVGLVEKGDFGGGASANCLKIVHGGLRYLQHLDFRRMRESIRERSTWLRIAPHLAEPLPFLLPTYRGSLQARPLLRAALAVNDAVGFDRNRHLAAERRVPGGRILSRAECLERVPELDARRITGGVLFHDAQMYGAERLVLAVVMAAAAAGARVGNYLELEAVRARGGRLEGARLRDRLGGASFEVRTRAIVNATGAAAPSVAARLLGRSPGAAPGYSVALNFVVPATGHRVAFAAVGTTVDPSARVRVGRRQLFVVPWRDRTLIGTAHLPFEGDPAEFAPEERHVERFLAEVRSATPRLPVSRDDVAVVHAGLLPVEGGGGPGGISLLKRHRILDHAADGLPGAFSVVSVKYTTARLVAQEVVDRVLLRLGLAARPCRTAGTPLPGGGAPAHQVLEDARRRHGGLLPPDVLEHLVRTYGTEYGRVLALRHGHPGWDARVEPGSAVIRAQLLRGILEEMAQRPEDLLQRRTELGARGRATAGAAFAAREAFAGSRRDPALARPVPSAG